MAINVGPVEIMLLIGGITQVIKNLIKAEGAVAQILVFVVGFVLTGLGYAYAQEMFSETVKPFVELGFVALAGSISAMGYYDLIFKKT